VLPGKEYTRLNISFNRIGASPLNIL